MHLPFGCRTRTEQLTAALFLSWSMLAATTKMPKTGQLINKRQFSHGGWKSKIKVQADSASGASLRSGS